MLADDPNATVNDFFAKNYMERHYVLSRERKVKIEKQDNVLYEKEAENLNWINREDNGYHIIVSKNIDEFRKEGNEQHNCVYRLKYYKKVISKESVVVFLRKEIDKPYVTIEFDYGYFNVIQATGKYNSKINEKLKNYIENLRVKLQFEYFGRKKYGLNALKEKETLMNNENNF